MADDEIKWSGHEGGDDGGEGAGNQDDSVHPEEPEELPASVIFMEMMRRAAEKQSTKDSPDRANKPPIVRHQRPSATPSAPSSRPLPAIPPEFEQTGDESESPRSMRRDARARPSGAEMTPPPAQADSHDTDVGEVGDTPAAEANDSEMAVSDAPAPDAPRPQKRPLTEEERRQQTMMEAQRIQRVKRRQQKRRARNVGIIGGLVRTFFVVIVSSGLMATILSWWTNSDFLRPEMRRSLQVALATGQAPTAIPTSIPTPNWLRTIGIVSGHSGPGLQASYDPGAVCPNNPDALNENEINFSVASRVVEELRRQGYRAELLEEFDARLDNYQAEALVSIHANTCAEFVGGASGFIVAKAAARAEGGEDTRLAECIAAYYEPMSGLARRFETTIDMTDYHSFREIHPLTPAAIIELGFMRDDYAVLTEKPDILAGAIVDGVLCYINREVVRPNALTATPEPESPEATIPPTEEPIPATPTG